MRAVLTIKEENGTIDEGQMRISINSEYDDAVMPITKFHDRKELAKQEAIEHLSTLISRIAVL